MTHRPSIHELEERLRAEARLARRPAPEGLLSRLPGASGAALTAAPSAAAPPVKGRPSRLRPLLGLAAAVLAVAALRRALPAGLTGGEAAPAGPFADLRAASARLAGQSVSSSVEHPLLQELELLGQDTARAAAALVRDLPGPLGGLFSGSEDPTPEGG